MTAGPFRRVLVGWDGSADAAEALGAAVAIAARDSGHVVALAVIRRSAYAEPDEDSDDEPAGLQRQAEAAFERLRQQDPAAAAVRMSAHVLSENESRAGGVLCAYAAEHGFDLLVLGRHGEGGSARTRLGRVAGAAIHASSVPLLLIAAT